MASSVPITAPGDTEKLFWQISSSISDERARRDAPLPLSQKEENYYIRRRLSGMAIHALKGKKTKAAKAYKSEGTIAKALLPEQDLWGFLAGHVLWARLAW